jgi:hypothetical protein
MITFYDAGTIRITDRWLFVGNHRYSIDGLHNLRKARGPVDRITQCAAGTAMLSLSVVLAVGSQIPWPTTTITIVIFVMPPAAMAAIRTRLRPAAYLLWADYQGSPVQLHQTRDATEFGKISRALVRSCCRIRDTAFRSP